MTVCLSCSLSLNQGAGNLCELVMKKIFLICFFLIFSVVAHAEGLGSKIASVGFLIGLGNTCSDQNPSLALDIEISSMNLEVGLRGLVIQELGEEDGNQVLAEYLPQAVQAGEYIAVELGDELPRHCEKLIKKY